MAILIVNSKLPDPATSIILEAAYGMVNKAKLRKIAEKNKWNKSFPLVAFKEKNCLTI